MDSGIIGSGQVAQTLGGKLLNLGDTTAPLATEMYLPRWLKLWSAAGTGALNIRVMAAQS